MVPGAAADIAFQVIADLGLGWLGVFLEQSRRRHHHPRCAEAALQAVIFLERLLDHVERAVCIGHAFDRRDIGPVRFGGEHGAGFDRLAVHMHHAGPALGRVAANMGAGHAQIFAQEIGQERVALHLAGDGFPVHRYRYVCHQTPPVKLSKIGCISDAAASQDTSFLNQPFFCSPPSWAAADVSGAAPSSPVSGPVSSSFCGPSTTFWKLVKNWSAIFLANPSMPRLPNCASLPPTLASTS